MSLFLRPLWNVLASPGLLLVLVGCGGGHEKGAKGPTFSAHSAEASVFEAPIENIQAPVTQLERARVVSVVDEGMGRFLQSFVVQESLNEMGAFQGFRIVRIDDRKYFEGLGIGQGDVVTRINDQPIERPAEAYAVFVGLRTAPSLDIDYLRGGRPMRLSLPIVGDPAVVKESAPTTTPSESAAEGPTSKGKVTGGTQSTEP